MLESAAVTPDLILINGNVRTLDSAHPKANALVCRCGDIAFVGDNEGALEFRAHDSHVLDVRGHLVLPAFVDAHTHFVGYAQSLYRVNLDGCHSLDEAIARVARRAATAGDGETILGRGWNHLDWDVPVFPDKRSLDQAAPHNPVVLTRKDGHSAWVNSEALARTGITRETVEPAGGRIDRWPDGEPTGIIGENALELLGSGIAKSDEEISEEWLLRAISAAHSSGIVTVHDIEGSNALRAWQLLRESGKLKLRVVYALPADMLTSALEIGVRRGFGDEWLKIQAVKFFADGSLGSKTAEMRTPFIGTEERGIPLTDSDTLLRTSRSAAQGGLDVWIHAIGDAAICRVLDVFQTLRAEGLVNPIFRMEHVQHLDPADLSRFAELNVIASMQPIHQPSDMRMVDDLLGPERASTSYAWNSLLQARATLAFGSDCPVETFEPLRGIHAAVTRQNEKGEPRGGWFPRERLTVEQAVKGFTHGAAAAGGDLERSGSLTVGKRADIVVLSQDIFSVPEYEILNTTIEHTIAGGEVVYAA